MTCPSKIIFVVPRSDGFLVSIDGVSYWKDMSPVQQLWMAERFLKAGMEGMREEEKKVLNEMEPVGRQED
mgnify:CR=1 FL=1